MSNNLLWGEWALSAGVTMLLITQTKLHPILCVIAGFGVAWLTDKALAPQGNVTIGPENIVATGTAPSANIPEPSEWEN